MNLISLFHIYAVVITLKNGLFSTLKIRSNYKIKVDPANSRAKTEIRSIWGGVYLGLGIAGLIFPFPEVYKMIGIMYIVSNLTRGISLCLTKSIDRSGLQSMSYEMILAVFLFL